MHQDDLSSGQKMPQAAGWYLQRVVEMSRRAAELGHEEAKQRIITHESE
jgi:hypothetical protein